MASEDWSRATWFVVFAGIADRYLWGFDVDARWHLRYESPALGTLAILPTPKRAARARLSDAVWIADCAAFDHDAPVGILPWSNNPQRSYPTTPVVQPWGDPTRDMHWYFRDLLGAFEAAAEMRFGAPYWLRYDLDEDSPPGTNFRERFAGREGLVSLYAMAARQADVLAEYLCLYRVLEAADLRNGTHFAETRIPLLREHRFGVLRVATTITDSSWVNAFEIYKSRAFVQLRRLERHGTKSPRDVAAHLYELRNALAHGKVGVKTSDFGAGVHQVAGALPIVKLLARMAVEP